MEVSVSLSCLFVHEPPYQDYSSVLQSCFRRGSSCMDHCTTFHVRVGFAQAHPNNRCWWIGPEFLCKPKAEWPITADLDNIEDTDIELIK